MDTQIVQEAEKIVNIPEISTYEKLDKPIIWGKKVGLFSFTPADLEHFVRLHWEDKNGYMQKYCLKAMTEQEATKFTATMFLTGQIKCWSVYLKQNSLKNLLDNKRAGFIYLTDFTTFSANISGIMDTAIMKGLLKFIRHENYTFAEDTIRTLVQHCFDCGLSRIETDVLANNRRALALDKKCGFVQEGIFRESFQMENQFYDTVFLSILKREFKNG